MKKLHEILGQAPSDGDVGVEIEVEGKNLPHVDDAFWRSEHDGSLRGEALEYVFKKPVKADKAPALLKHLDKIFKAQGSELNFSFRTSVHVHVNCQHLTHAEYVSYIYTYLLLEEALMNYCGKDRKGNRFCLRLQDAEGVLENLQYVFQHERGLMDVAGDNMRYSAINLAATLKYGSLEFRAMRGNMDVDILSTWVATLVRLRDFSKEMGTPVAVYDLFAKLGARGFMKEALGELFEHYDYLKAAQDIQRSFSLSIDLPYAYKPAKEVKPKAAVKWDAAAHLNAAAFDVRALRVDEF